MTGYTITMNTKIANQSLFDPKLFWEISDIDFKQQPLTTIFKVMRYGSIQDVRSLKKIYDSGQIQSFLTKKWNELYEWERRLLSTYYWL